LIKLVLLQIKHIYIYYFYNTIPKIIYMY
jgi:hypothetical protein